METKQAITKDKHGSRLSVGAGETTAKAETTALQGGRAKNALCAVADGDTPSSAPHLLRGAQAEILAEKFLAKRGLRIIARNFRIKGGEIDLICSEGDTTVFVEVRLRTSKGFGGAAASITAHKQRRLILAARHWLLRNGDCACRFDCVLLDGLDEARIEWLRGAFSAD